MVHKRLTEILNYFGVHYYLVKTLDSFNTDRTIYMAFDRQEEEAVPFQSGLPQGFPLSPVLFVIYTAALNTPAQQPHDRHETSYVDDELMIQGATSEKGASAYLQARLDQWIKRAEVLNIKFAPGKAELMHLTHKNGAKGANQDTMAIRP